MTNRFRVLAAVFLFASVALRAEFPIEARTRTEPVRSWRGGHAVATNANGALVAWVDSRPRVEVDFESATQVRAMRFDAQGQRLDERDLAIAATGSNVHVATDGVDYMVAYDHPQLGVRLVRVPGSGGAPVPVDLHLNTTYKGLFYAAGHYFVYAVDLFVLDRQGNLVRPKIGLFWAHGPKDMRIADAGDGRVLFVWDRTAGQLASATATIDDLVAPQFERFDAPVDLPPGWVEGLVRGPEGFALLTRYYVDRKVTALITMLDRDGQLAAAPQNLFEFASSGQADTDFDETELFLAPLGTGYAVVTDHHWGPGSAETRKMKNGAAFLRLDASGRPRDSQFTRVTDQAGDVGAAGATDGTLWVGYEDGGATRVQNIDAAGRLLLAVPDPIASQSRASQSAATIERCAAFDLVVWQEAAAGRSITKARRFSRQGERLGPAFAIDPRSTEYEASVVCGRDAALATWSVGNERRAAMIGASGPPVPVAAASSGSPMVFDGTFFVGPVFETEVQPAGTSLLTVRFQRWTEQGDAVEEATPRFPLNAGTLHSAALGWNGTDFLLAWFSLRRPGYPPVDFPRIMRFNRELTPLGPPAAVHTPLYFAGVKGLAVSASRDQWLVAWVAGYLQIGWSHPLRDDWFVTTSRISAGGSFLDADQSVVNEQWSAYDGLSQVSWNGARWELMTAGELGTLTLDGTMQLHTLLDAASLAAVSPAGSQRLLVYTRVDPADGVADLRGEVRNEREWQSAGQPRRRSSRH